MKNNFISALRLTIVCAVFFCGVYTTAVWSVAKLSNGEGKGVIVIEDNKRYHVNVAQNFSSDHYFWSRPSAVDYNAAGSGGSNKGPSNPEYLALVKSRIDSFLVHNPGIKKSEIPADLVTASGSGIDPHISVQAAKVQVKRISERRKITTDTLMELIASNTEKPLMGLFGTERVHVLKLNIDLDRVAGKIK